ncbi:MAG: hydroxymethylglutaryl-CoA lyase [Chloroflexi bacterium]|nr:MAG: hydroxymethylglutaryl-CoA lyase [Chloroflexota bacterium]
MLANLPKAVTIVDVTTRDGFQMETGPFIPTAAKIEIVNRIARSGIPEIQVTSFVHPRAVPQLADAAEVFQGIDRLPGVKYRALVPNAVGAERALAAGADELNLMVSVTDSHSLANANRTTADALALLEPVLELAERAGVPATAGGATGLGCPFEGFPPVERLYEVYGFFYERGVRKMSVADTAGMANPLLVYDRLSRLRERFPEASFALHLHDTRRMATANILAGLEAGVTEYDGAVGGLGGCPYSPGATGNIATEELVHFFDALGISTGVDLDALLTIARRLREIVGHELDSAILRAGKSTDLLGPRTTGQTKLVS